MASRVKVDLGERSYDIVIGRGVLDELGTVCADLGLKATALIVSDSNVAPAYGDHCESALKAAGIQTSHATVPAGETSKSHDQLIYLYTSALDAGLDRSSFIVALGGGVVGDLGGYLAATYLRGIPCVQVPTTIVAMVDSAVGGKTGVNMPQGKNLIGSFWQPASVVADLATLHSLPPREYISGLAEVVKYGVIWDADFFAMLENRADDILERDESLLEEIIARCCEIKADVVRLDEREGGVRAILNYGHTVGHAIENVTRYGTYLHGEAISMGMVYAAGLSVLRQGFPKDHDRRLVSLLGSLGLPTTRPACAWSDLRRAVAIDKKSVGQSPRFVLAETMGRVKIGCEVEDAVLEEVWNGFGE